MTFSHFSLSNSAMLVCFRHLGTNQHHIPMFFASSQNSNAVVVASTTSIVKDAFLMLVPQKTSESRHDKKRHSGIIGHRIKSNTFDFAWSFVAVRKLCSRWIPHNLTKVQKDARVTWSKATLKRFNGEASNLVWNIVTGDESWIYSYDPSQHNASCHTTKETVDVELLSHPLVQSWPGTLWLLFVPKY